MVVTEAPVIKEVTEVMGMAVSVAMEALVVTVAASAATVALVALADPEAAASAVTEALAVLTALEGLRIPTPVAAPLMASSALEEVLAADVSTNTRSSSTSRLP